MNLFCCRQGSLCSICSTALISEKDICLRCRERDSSFESNLSLFLYRDEVKELLKQYKAKNTKSLSGFFVDLMGPVIRKKYPGFTIIPVPYRPSGKRRRGWDQIEVICRGLKKEFGLPVLPILKRRNSAPQKALNYSERQANLTGQISIRRYKSSPAKALLIDDVFTTGATANTCAEVLKKSGSREVRMLSLALDQ